MDNIVLILLVVVIILLVVFIGMLAFFGHRFLKLKEQNKIIEKPVAIKEQESQKKDSIDPKLLTALRSNDKVQFQSSVYCVDHPEVFSHGKCSISYEALCESCLTKQENILVGRKYLDLFLDNDWIELQMIKDEKELRKRYISIKKKLWDEENLPVIVQGHFKINVQDDQVEQYIVILSREEDITRVKNEFSIA